MPRTTLVGLNPLLSGVWILKIDHERFFADPAKSPITWRGVDKGWVDKDTGAQLRFTAIGRSIWIKPFTGGKGEVRRVHHFYLEGENPYAAITHGEPIYEDELMQVVS